MKVFLAFLFLKTLVQSYLDLRQRKSILNNREKIPTAFADSLSLEDHQKAADYTLAKMQTSKIFRSFGLVILLLWTVGGGLDFLFHKVSGLSDSQLHTGVIFFFAFAAINFVIDLPQSLYMTFVLEEKFGFNKTTPKLFFMDMLKGLILSAILGTPLLYAILWFIFEFRDWWWLYTWITMTLFQFFLIWLYPQFIAPLFNKFTPLDEPELKTEIDDLLEKTNFTAKEVFSMDASKRSAHGNAYFTGFGKNKRIVFFDTLLKTLDKEEIRAVLAHELGHFKCRHILKGMIKSILLSLVMLYFVDKLIDWEIFYIAHGVKTLNASVGLLLVSLVMPVYTFLFLPVSSFLQRKYEFQADHFACQYAKGEKLVSALVKLHKDNASTLTPDEVYSNFYYSHPPASIRIKHILQQSDDLREQEATA